jgi:hypothetical protein
MDIFKGELPKTTAPEEETEKKPTEKKRYGIIHQDGTMERTSSIQEIMEKAKEERQS